MTRNLVNINGREKDHGRNMVELGLELRLGLVLALGLGPGFNVRVSNSCRSTA